MVKTENHTNIPVPCGKCPSCLTRRASSWSFRLYQETKNHYEQYFVTLTYDTKYVPITTGSHPMSLNKYDIQTFLKRVRKHHPSRTVKYFAVGEYGGKTNRPHYHIIIFGATKESIAKSWDKGQIHFGHDTSPAAIGYLVKYMLKPSKIPTNKNDRRQPEFQLSSKGIGLSYLSKEIIKYHQSDLSNSVLTIEGTNKVISMPRYYKNKIYTKEQLGILKGIQEAQAKIKELETPEITEDYKQSLYEKQYKSHNKNRTL